MIFILGDCGVQRWPMGEGVGQRSLLSMRLTHSCSLIALPPVHKAGSGSRLSHVLSSEALLVTERDALLPTGHFVAHN